MSDTRTTSYLSQPARIRLESYTADLRLTALKLGIDNIHYDVFLSPKFVDFARAYILDILRQSVNFSLAFERLGKARSPEHPAFRKLLTEVLQESLTRAKFQQSIETDILHRLALLKFLTQEMTNQFASLLVECKERIRARGQHFEHSEQAHVLRSRISEIQTDRKRFLRLTGDIICRIWREIEEGLLAKSRRALFGGDADLAQTYDLLQNRLLFVESGNDEYLFLEHYILLGNFVNDPDRFDVFDSFFLEFLNDFVLPEDNADELAKARRQSELLLDQARQLRADLGRIERDQEDLQPRTDRLDAFPRLFHRRAEHPNLHAEQLHDLRAKAVALTAQLEALGPQIEAAKQRLEFLAEENQSRLGDYLNEPSNAPRLFDSSSPPTPGEPSAAQRAHLLEEWLRRLEEKDLLLHVIASYELRQIHGDYCPPVHLQQLKKALVSRDEACRVEQILEQFPARKISMKRLDESARAMRRRTHDEALAAALQFAEDFMRLRRDRRNFHLIAAWLERINLVRSERSRDLSRANKSLYEFLHPQEERPVEDPIINHVVIKADVRGSTRITKDLLARGMNPASHFSMSLHEPVKRMLERYSAAKVFIEGDAIILAIYENESNRAAQRAVARACVLAREIILVTQAYNARIASTDLPPLELGVGIAFQDSAPSLWMDGDSKIMISKALNLSDRLSGCSKIAKRLFQTNPAPFRIYLMQTLMNGAVDDEGEDLLVRYNLNGIELNEEGFQKLSAEISLAPLVGNFTLPWGKEKVQLYFGEVPLGESIEPIVIRKGFVRELLPGGTVGEQGARAYYEVCTDEKLLDLARKKITGSAWK